jgi:hypothetical protein
MAPKRSWPMPTAVAALVLFAIAIPLGCILYGLRVSLSFPGATPPTDDDLATTGRFLAAAVISAVIAIGMALASAFAGRGAAVRVVAVIAILVALVTGGVPGVILLSQLRGQSDSADGPSEPVAPACGAESHPVVFGGDSRYVACPDDIATANDLLTTAVTQLPTENVTAASVDAVASGIEPELYAGTHAYDNGDIVVAWSPAPVTCAMALWRDGSWTPEAVGLLVDGGCIYVGG